MLVRLMSKGEYLIVPKGTKFTGAGKLGLNNIQHDNNFLDAVYEFSKKFATACFSWLQWIRHRCLSVETAHWKVKVSCECAIKCIISGDHSRTSTLNECVQGWTTYPHSRSNYGITFLWIVYRLCQKKIIQFRFKHLKKLQNLLPITFYGVDSPIL